MNLKDLELLFKESGCEYLNFRMIDEWNEKKGKTRLTIKQKLNLCAQVKYHQQIIKTYIWEENEWISGFKWLEESDK